MKKDELYGNTHPHITDGGNYINTLYNILKEYDKERTSLEKKFGKPRSKYHR